MKIIDIKTVKFLAVGVANTLVGAGLMFLLYNLAGLSYWLSSAANYVVGSILSFVLNRRFTFGSTEPVAKTLPRFIVNILACYLIAYGIARPLARLVFASLGEKTRDNIAMLVGMVLFTVCNYVGQRFFTFRRGERDD